MKSTKVIIAVIAVGFAAGLFGGYRSGEPKTGEREISNS
jgi:hypothetical protein